MESDQLGSSLPNKELKLPMYRLNSKLLEDYLNQIGCNNALSLRYFLLCLELDELKKQKSKSRVFQGDEINLLPSIDSCSNTNSGLFCEFFIK